MKFEAKLFDPVSIETKVDQLDQLCFHVHVQDFLQQDTRRVKFDQEKQTKKKRKKKNVNAAVNEENLNTTNNNNINKQADDNSRSSSKPFETVRNQQVVEKSIKLCKALHRDRSTRRFTSSTNEV